MQYGGGRKRPPILARNAPLAHFSGARIVRYAGFAFNKAEFRFAKFRSLCSDDPEHPPGATPPKRRGSVAPG